MNALIPLLPAAHLPEAGLYLIQAVTYALAFRAIRKGGHVPCQVYLASAVIHAAICLLLCWPIK